MIKEVKWWDIFKEWDIPKLYIVKGDKLIYLGKIRRVEANYDEEISYLVKRGLRTFIVRDKISLFEEGIIKNTGQHFVKYFKQEEKT